MGFTSYTENFGPQTADLVYKLRIVAYYIFTPRTTADIRKPVYSGQQFLVLQLIYNIFADTFSTNTMLYLYSGSKLCHPITDAYILPLVFKTRTFTLTMAMCIKL